MVLVNYLNGLTVPIDIWLIIQYTRYIIYTEFEK